MKTPEPLAALLRERGADAIDHPGGTLGGHLARVQVRLAELGLSGLVQLAGRAHAVYGTDGFDVRLLTLDERPLLAGLIGQDGEELVYRYGACARGRTWTTLPVDGRVHDRFTGVAVQLGGDQVRDFADLSLVNEIDVAEHAPGFVDRNGVFFRRLTRAWEPVLSPSVVAEARRVFG